MRLTCGFLRTGRDVAVNHIACLLQNRLAGFFARAVTATAAAIAASARLLRLNHPLHILDGRCAAVQPRASARSLPAGLSPFASCTRSTARCRGNDSARRDLPLSAAPLEGHRSSAATAAAAAAAAVTQMSTPTAAAPSWRYYTGSTATCSARYKIHGYEPCDLRPDWQALVGRLARTCGQGAYMAGSYVRQGCVELTLDFLVAAGGPRAPAGIANGSSLDNNDLHSVKPPPCPYGRGSDVRGVTDSGSSLAPDAAEILKALGLDGCSSGTTVTTSTATATPDGFGDTLPAAAAVPAALPSPQVQLLGMEPAASDAPRVVQLWPRVLVLPAAAAAPPGGGGRAGLPSRRCADEQQLVRAEAPEASPSAAHADADGATIRQEQAASREVQLVWGSEEGEEGEDGSDQAATAGRATAAAAAATAAPLGGGTVLLRAIVCRPPPPPCTSGRCKGGGRMRPLEAPAVFARGQGEILSTRVLRFQLRATAAVSDSSSPFIATCRNAAGSQSAPMTHTRGGQPGSSGGGEHYELEMLLAQPRRAGILLVEVSWSNQPGHVMTLIALPATEAAVAAELQDHAMAAAAPPSQPLRATTPEAVAAAAALDVALARRQQRLLNSFLLDAGVWAAQQALAAAAAAADDGCAAADSTAMEQLHPRQRAMLGTNLMCFAARADLKATEAWLLRGLSQLETALGRREAHEGAGRKAGGTHAVVAEAEVAAAAGAPPRGCSRGQAFEILALLTLLARARVDLLSAANITTVMGGLPGVVSLLSYLLLPRHAWGRVVRCIKVPRYGAYVAVKAVSMFLDRPLPPGVSSYHHLGLGRVLHEGLLLSLACLYAAKLCEAKRSIKAAAYWSIFDVLLVKGVVNLVCTVCNKSYSAKNPSAVCPDHYAKHQKDVASAVGSEQSGAPTTNSTKCSRAEEGPVRTFFLAAVQIATFLKHLALFFFKCNIALQLRPAEQSPTALHPNAGVSRMLACVLWWFRLRLGRRLGRGAPNYTPWRHPTRVCRAPIGVRRVPSVERPKTLLENPGKDKAASYAKFQVKIPPFRQFSVWPSKDLPN
ncbi:hypothetical protein VOLCADRAFT_93488 [Volvox carteri f. nagariensis]|uniref:Uncharacterized protein n=1 Tax=Volvox carteri f. nagariensis TaxID=3068 RepID=D8U291_VOLCA|nr:uncharacterized protein VOLCADRAFT_93488 [Volvox carteri f. nagariensis]EFJ46024.1 hypothetical protein VOLCADRAFT_93488 [Volvox carteri f. nagariensis]|eukprot:XP_002952774.1 hypothetical protein VOLCADRAFT_93488 [Volvox carteri f. nagariensis]